MSARDEALAGELRRVLGNAGITDANLAAAARVLIVADLREHGHAGRDGADCPVCGHLGLTVRVAEPGRYGIISCLDLEVPPGEPYGEVFAPLYAREMLVGPLGGRYVIRFTAPPKRRPR